MLKETEKEIKSIRQDRIIAALLTSTNIKSAAQKAGIGERTLHRLIRSPGFARIYRQRRMHVFETAMNGIVEIVDLAIAELKDTLQNETSRHNRLRAAELILNFARQAVLDGDLAARVEELERNLTRTLNHESQTTNFIA
jgi:hypothetical protein